MVNCALISAVLSLCLVLNNFQIVRNLPEKNPMKRAAKMLLRALFILVSVFLDKDLQKKFFSDLKRKIVYLYPSTEKCVLIIVQV